MRPRERSPAHSFFRASGSLLKSTLVFFARFAKAKDRVCRLSNFCRALNHPCFGKGMSGSARVCHICFLPIRNFHLLRYRETFHLMSWCAPKRFDGGLRLLLGGFPGSARAGPTGRSRFYLNTRGSLITNIHLTNSSP